MQNVQKSSAHQSNSKDPETLTQSSTQQRSHNMIKRSLFHSYASASAHLKKARALRNNTVNLMNSIIPKLTAFKQSSHEPKGKTHVQRFHNDFRTLSKKDTSHLHMITNSETSPSQDRDKMPNANTDIKSPVHEIPNNEYTTSSTKHKSYALRRNSKRYSRLPSKLRQYNLLNLYAGKILPFESFTKLSPILYNPSVPFKIQQSRPYILQQIPVINFERPVARDGPYIVKPGINYLYQQPQSGYGFHISETVPIGANQIYMMKSGKMSYNQYRNHKQDKMLLNKPPVRYNSTLTPLHNLEKKSKILNSLDLKDINKIEPKTKDINILKIIPESNNIIRRNKKAISKHVKTALTRDSEGMHSDSNSTRRIRGIFSLQNEQAKSLFVA